MNLREARGRPCPLDRKKRHGYGFSPCPLSFLRARPSRGDEEEVGHRRVQQVQRHGARQRRRERAKANLHPPDSRRIDNCIRKCAQPWGFSRSRNGCIHGAPRSENLSHPAGALVAAAQRVSASGSMVKLCQTSQTCPAGRGTAQRPRDAGCSWAWKSGLVDPASVRCRKDPRQASSASDRCAHDPAPLATAGHRRVGSAARPPLWPRGRLACAARQSGRRTGRRATRRAAPRPQPRKRQSVRPASGVVGRRKYGLPEGSEEKRPRHGRDDGPRAAV